MEVLEMAVKKKETQAEEQNAQDETALAAVEENAPAEDFPAELREAVWSVVSFDKCEASNLTYAEAEQKLNELEAQKVSGLCIVTDETAARIAAKN
jgi:hypothetical protein